MNVTILTSVGAAVAALDGDVVVSALVASATAVVAAHSAPRPCHRS